MLLMRDHMHEPSFQKTGWEGIEEKSKFNPKKFSKGKYTVDDLQNMKKDH